ncbi:MAG: spermidine/putrescine ABC transporter substrate-binding protein [Chloroflexota bacterium]|nr:spermidine/putrescine ABC transporter substrate-binding protein [Chloroflexota bacterium]
MADQDLDNLLQRMAKAKVNRRGFMAAAGYGSLAAFLAACAGAKSSASPSSPGASVAAPTIGPSGTPIAAEPSYAIEGGLYMYNWADYISEENIKTFQTRYGITDWSYDIYPSNIELLTKLQAGATGLYDIAAPTAEYVPQMVEGGYIQKIDWSKVPNQKYINAQFKGLWWDPKDEYQLPKDWGTTGITVRTKFVKEDVSSWKKFFEVAPKYTGKIIVVDSPGDVFCAPLKALGFSLNSVDPGELEQARQLLLGLAPHVLALNSDTYEVPLGNGEAVLGLTWTGGIDGLIAAPETADTKYIIPSDGTLYWMDTWVMLANPPHPEGAHAWLNFIHEPEIQAKETISNAYATPNDEAKKFIPDSILNDPTIFVPDDIFPSLEGAEPTETNPLRAQIWEEFKSKIGK